MGLTRSSTGQGVLSAKRLRRDCFATVAFIGNPNVGKSTLFNALTGLKQHTGNWTGKTVENAEGFTTHRGRTFRLVDLPGTYSLSARSPEERIACDYISSDRPDAVVVVCDAAMPERTLLLAVQLIRRNPRTVVCMNLMDEAQKRGIVPDLTKLSALLGVPVVGTTARDKKGLDALMDAVAEVASRPHTPAKAPVEAIPQEQDYAFLERMQASCIRTEPTRRVLDREASDRFFQKRWVSLPITALLLVLVFWLTLVGANIPSALLSDALFWVHGQLSAAFSRLNAPAWIGGLLLDGVYRTLAWVVSVMLPPMAIFFPLFTLLEDAGLLPRIAFGADHAFSRCRACGKQALTLCMGFGCNAAGVVGCRIIGSKRERRIAILTNAFVPCNGRFPALLTVTSVLMLLLGGSGEQPLVSALLLSLLVLASVLLTLTASWILGHTLGGGDASSYVLEIPPMRVPKLGQVLIRSLLDRTLAVLGRAAAIAAPCGAVLWCLANLTVDGRSLLAVLTELCDPLARPFGLDGTMLLAFLLGSPANEIVLPIAYLIYGGGTVLAEPASNAALFRLFLQHGWTARTAVCTLLFTVLHWPCATTLLSIRKETKSAFDTLLALLLPTAFGLLLCFLVTSLCRLLGY